MLHENRHLTQIRAARRAGLDPFDFDRSMAAILEWDAYNFELALARHYQLSDEYVAVTHLIRDRHRWLRPRVVELEDNLRCQRICWLYS